MTTKLVSALVLAAPLALAGLAMADETVTGAVTSFDPDTRMLVLGDTGEFTLSDALEFEGVEEGTEVTLTIEEIDGERRVTAIETSTE